MSRPSTPSKLLVVMDSDLRISDFRYITCTFYSVTIYLKPKAKETEIENEKFSCEIFSKFFVMILKFLAKFKKKTSFQILNFFGKFLLEK